MKSFNIYKAFSPQYRYEDTATVIGREYGEKCVAPGECWVYTRAYNSSVADPEKRIVFHTLAGALTFMRRHGSPSYHVTYDGVSHVKRFGYVFCAVNRKVYRVSIEVVAIK